MSDVAPYFDYVENVYRINKETWPDMTEEDALADAIALADRVYGMPHNYGQGQESKGAESGE